MADGERNPATPDEPEPGASTELIPTVQTDSTRELPAVTAPVAPPPSARPPVQQPVEQPVQPPLPPPAPPRPPSPTVTPSSPGAPRSVSLRSLVTGLIVVVMVAVIGLAAWKLAGRDDEGGTDTAGQQQSGSAVEADVSSFDPSGGSGFRADGSDWVTQTYTSATFGNLKKGVGLQLDLGEKRALDEISFTADGATVVLRSADSPAQFADGYQQVGEEKVADGPTTLSGEGGGEHRYWMIWVPRLGQDGGFSARIGDIKVTAS